MNITEELERLSKLHSSGTLSDDEFAKAKSRLLSQQEQTTAPAASTGTPAATVSKKSGTAKIVRGIISLILGLAVFLWAREHSPRMGFGEMLTKMDSYILKPELYNVVLIICALLGLNGLYLLVTGFQANQRRD